MSSDDSGIYTLSDFYPENTIYFYGFPAGESLHFFNLVPLEKEEVVSARPLVCCGEKMKVICFPSALNQEAWELMTEYLHVNLISRDKVLVLPERVHGGLKEKTRNQHVNKALFDLTKEGKFVMAQPFTAGEVTTNYLIDSKVTVAMNDKIQRSAYVPEKYLPKCYKKYLNGKEFFEDSFVPPLPCVVKVSSSSAGDGVRICFTKEEYETAKKDFASLSIKIMSEEFIHAVHNIGVQFGIPYDGEPQIIGYSEQFIDNEGNYLGGVINPAKKIPIVEKITSVLKNEVLPNARKLGWFGIGGMDVLTDKDDNLFMIDPNFRMTAATSFIFLNKSKPYKRSLISFMGDFVGTKEDFIKKVVPIADENNPDQTLKVIALTKRRNVFGINAGIFFDKPEDLRETCLKLVEMGFKGKTLDKILHSNSFTLGHS